MCPTNSCSRQRDIMAQIRCMAVSVSFPKRNCQQTNQKQRGKTSSSLNSAVNTIPFSTQASRKWKVHTVAVIIKSHKKRIRVLVTENACNVAEFSRQRASITASVRAAKIRCHGGKDPIRLILKRINLRQFHYKIGQFFETRPNLTAVAAITGNEDLRMLHRYTQLRGEAIARKLDYWFHPSLHRSP